MKSRLLPCILALCPVLFSQTASRSGQLTDSTGGALDNAHVVVNNEETNQQFTARTNREGMFAIPSLPHQSTFGTSAIGYRQTDGDSFYNAMLLEARRRGPAGLNFHASCTWAKGIDDTGATVNNALLDMQNLGRDGVSPNLASGQRSPQRWFNAEAFAAVPAVDPVTGFPRFGNAGRNTVLGPGLNTMDAALAKCSGCAGAPG